MLTAIFFAMLFSDNMAKRIEFVLKAYLASCLFAAAAGIASYYDLFDGILFKMDGRAAGVFEDPNVLGSFWLAMVVATATMVALMYRTSLSARLRARIVVLSVATVAICTATLAGALTVGDIAERFEDRAQLTKDYDEGVTGRFGNQLRSLPMLIERPNGFGPLRFRLFFGLEPHNSYIGGFANGGWIGGFSFIFLVLATGYLGSR